MQQSKVSVKYSEENSVFNTVSYYLSVQFLWEGVGWGGGLLTCSVFRMGAHSWGGRLLEVGRLFE